jgi:hypothetical protein
VDSASIAGWHDDDETIVPACIETIGFLIDETDDHLTLAGSLNDDGGWSGAMSIPTCAVQWQCRW